MRRLGFWILVWGAWAGAWGSVVQASVVKPGVVKATVVKATVVKATVVKATAQYFTTVGSMNSFQFLPESYREPGRANEFFYDVFYYIPAALKDSRNVKALIFNHGGGDSTLTREGSVAAVKKYLPDLRKIADELGIVVVLPSANGLNWGGHTVGLMRELVRMIRADLRVDANRIGLSGHSMGGMGITRNYYFLADQFAFFLPMAAGMDLAYAPAEQTEWQINKVFNVPYIHLQGLNDHFDVFVERCKEQVRRTEELESRYGVPSKLKMVFTNDDHNYDYATFKEHLENAFLTPRDLYPKKLWGTITTDHAWGEENRIRFKWGTAPKYFWVEAVEKNGSDSFNFFAEAKGNVIRIDLKSKPRSVKTLRLHLHSRLVNLRKRVKVFVNGVHVATRRPRFFGLKKQVRDWVEVEIPRSRD